ncbi:bone marrow proteoglycan [Buteo buteo]|uniref:bone marrow proteoglycan n=1 Tax=Buteo buteo TaxID=30397 RepID=UPI003EC0504F
MQPCLLLVLALLGTASASHPAPDSPEVDEAALEVPEEDARCPLQSETRAFSVANPLGASTFRYVIITRCQNFHNAQHICARCYRGRLASIHSYSRNSLLQRQARLSTNRGQVWIGAITQPVGRNVRCWWTDQSRWNYSYWLQGYPLRSHLYCTSLCTNNGRWRSVGCQVRLPFICEY